MKDSPEAYLVTELVQASVISTMREASIFQPCRQRLNEFGFALAATNRGLCGMLPKPGEILFKAFF